MNMSKSQNIVESTVAHRVELPIEVIIYILEYLPLSDRIVAGQVCQLWYEASKDVNLRNTEVVVLHDDLTRPLAVLAKSSKIFSHFVFKEVGLNGKLTRFWDRFCPRLQSLSLHSCDISERSFINVLSKCYRLETLSVNDCRELLMSGRVLERDSDIVLLSKTLVRLKKLSLAFNRYLSDALFNKFVAIAPNLEDLSVTGCQISFHSGLCKKFYPSSLSKNGSVMASESVLTFNNILQYIMSQANQLCKIRFGHTLMDNDALTKLAKVPGLHLKAVNLQSCEQLNNTGIVALTTHQNFLQELDLSMCSRITDHSVLAICSNLVNVQVLNLRRCRAITNISISELYRLKKLIDLDLSQCELVTGEGIRKGLCSYVNPKFQRLHLTALSLDEDCICLLARCLPGLTYLDLGWCFNAVTDQCIQAICRNQVWLRTLKLTACDKVTDAGLTGMGICVGEVGDKNRLSHTLTLSGNGVPLGQDFRPANSSVGNERISLRSKAEQGIVNDAKLKNTVSQLCEEQFLSLEKTEESLANLKGLRDLDLSSCSRITDVSLKYTFCFTELQHLNLSQCQQVTQAGLSYLAINNPSIESLILAQCFNITDDGVITVVKTLPRLKHLDLQGCKQLTDASLHALCKCCNNLHYLDISQCYGMSLEGSNLLEGYLPALHTLHRRGLPSLGQLTCVVVPQPAPLPPPPPPTQLSFQVWR